MTVPGEMWVAVGAEKGRTLDEVRARIAELDGHPMTGFERHFDMPHSYFDRDLQPITLGEWSELYESVSYRFIRQTVLPNRFWVATIWTGMTDDPFTDDPPRVMRTGVFRLNDTEREKLPEPTYEETHGSLAEALEAHPRIVDRYAR